MTVKDLLDILSVLDDDFEIWLVEKDLELPLTKVAMDRETKRVTLFPRH